MLLSMSLGALYAQTTEELEAQKSEKNSQLAELEAQAAALKSEIAAIDKQLVVLPRWETGAFGVVGLNFNGFNNWLGRAKPNVTTSNIGISVNAFANRFSEKAFWRNSLNTNFGWVKFDDRDDDTDNPGYEQSADVINFSSLLGLNLSKTLALSTLAEYRSTLLSNFNNPGYLDIGAGLTWTPFTNFVAVIHPLNYNFVFSSDDFAYESSLGAKVVVEYTQKFDSGLSWRSNLSGFLSYADVETLSNWTWVNGIGFSLWKGIGVGFELGLRKNRQEADAAKASGGPVVFSGDSPLQSYYVLGVTYNIGAK